MATMESLIGLVNRIQRACTVLGDHGGEGSLWEALPSVAVVGGQSSGKSSVLESVVGRDFLPRGSGNAIEKRDLCVLPLSVSIFPPAVRKEIQDETDRITGKSKQISNVPIHLSIYSPNVSLANIIYFTVVNLTLIDLPGLTKVAVALGRCSQTHLYRLYRFMVLEGRSYRLQHPWVGIVNRSQADINKNVDMIAARRKEQEYFATSPDYGHLAHKMGSEYLAKLLSQVHFVLKDLVRKSIGETEPDTAFPPCELQRKQLGAMLDEDPTLMEKRDAIAKRLQLYTSARDEIDSVAWK
ncbi:hypothetical protein GW17_00038380 [Ensete ventricosum]|nr:hypothetical protein GW17_00038380 [Ensete ventricosum]